MFVPEVRIFSISLLVCEFEAGENSSFIFKLAYVVLHPWKWLSKNFSKPTSKNGEIGRFLIGLYI